MAILNIKDLTKNFGHVKALYNITLSVEEGGITSLIGPNGAGKTTFYNLVTGAFPPAAGKIVFKEEDITGFLPFKIWRR